MNHIAKTRSLLPWDYLINITTKIRAYLSVAAFEDDRKGAMTDEIILGKDVISHGLGHCALRDGLGFVQKLGLERDTSLCIHSILTVHQHFRFHFQNLFLRTTKKLTRKCSHTHLLYQIFRHFLHF